MKYNNVVTILLCTFNGEKYLRKQLYSLQRQTVTHWRCIASDDGSKDQTMDILREFQTKWGKNKLRILDGPKSGFINNFRAAAKFAEGMSEFYAFCDQDDVWHADKLECALGECSKFEGKNPMLFGTSTLLIDSDDNMISKSKLVSRNTDFRNAIIENVAGGNTMVFNSALLSLFNSIPEKNELVSHDWTLYQLVTVCGGHFSYVDDAKVNYRQHKNNLIGGKASFSGRITRLGRFMSGKFKNWMNTNAAYLKHFESEMTPQNYDIYKQVMYVRELGFYERVLGVLRLKVNRQSKLETLIFKFGFILGKV